MHAPAVSFPLLIDVPVSDIAAAVGFYSRAFEASARPGPAGEVEMVWDDRPDGVILRIVDETTHVPDAADRKFYIRGETPRMEMRVDDVDEWVTRAAEGGATVLFRLVSGPDRMLRRPEAGDGPICYSHFRDPFGHLWAIRLVDEERERQLDAAEESSDTPGD